MNKHKWIIGLQLLCQALTQLHGQPAPIFRQREHLSMDRGWRFALGHLFDKKKDFNNGMSYFSYFAKAGYGDGAAALNFDDRAWRELDLPHDWAAELPFDGHASYSHGFKALGSKFPEACVGWYRKTFTIPASDLGRDINFCFDGVFRNSTVWLNGHYLGTESSGYLGFEYDISDYLNYGGENVVAVRVDASMEEGWFYEGAGIYRHVWLKKTAPVHVATDGTFASAVIQGSGAIVTARVTINNEGGSSASFDIGQTILDEQDKAVATGRIDHQRLPAFGNGNFHTDLNVADAKLWSPDSPYRYKLVTILLDGADTIDRFETRFGIRTIRFDANEGFFLNGRRLEIKGTNNHQDHAGVGTAIPDALDIYRIRALKGLGSNAYRCSHHPPAPELLDACDSLGMLVIDENRLMGTTAMHLNNLKRMILRDRNHPSVISWSIGNEEWQIENTEIGSRIARRMQAFANDIDSTRAITAAFSGGWGSGISAVMELIGFNYIAQEDPDGQHKKFPAQKGWGTEEGSTFATRGIYFPDSVNHWIPAYDKKPRAGSYSIEEGWNYYVKRPFLAGMFIWTGFDYRGEPTPYGWPSINSYFGMLDVCGFPKDDAWYLRSWWGDKTVLHLLPHWNWKGREGQPIAVWVYSNCDEVELYLNKKSFGRKIMPRNGHLEWRVPYAEGILEARGYKGGRQVLTDIVQTTGAAAVIRMEADRASIRADGKDVSVITVRVNDKKERKVPTADNSIRFGISGPGRIIGVGNGNPTSLEPDQFHEKISSIAIEDFGKITGDPGGNEIDSATITYQGNFSLPIISNDVRLIFYYNSIGSRQSIIINGKEIARDIPQEKKGNSFILDKAILKKGVNHITIIALPLLKNHPWDEVNTHPGLIQLTIPARDWQRKLFNGLAQVIVQSTGNPGKIKLSAMSAGLEDAAIMIDSQ